MTDNTIEALRILQVGVEAVASQGAFTMGVQPTAGKTQVLGDVTYTWRAPGVLTSGEISIGTNLATAKTAYLAAIEGSDGHNDPNPYVTASAFSGDISTITARIPGPIGDTIIFTLPTPDGGNSVNGAGTLGATTAGSMARGDRATPTTRLAVEQLEFDASDYNTYHPQVQNGILQRYQGAGVPTYYGTKFTLPSQAAIWEQLPLFFSMLFGAAVVSGDLGGPYTYVWTVDPTKNPNPYAATLQRRFDNGLGDEIDEEATYAMLTELGLAFSANEELKLDGGTGFARKFASINDFAESLTLPEFEVMVSLLSTIYFDDTFAGVGNTPVAEQVIGWSWKFLSGVFARSTAEGRQDLSFTKHQMDGRARGVDMEITCLLDPDTYAAEVARAADPATNRFAVQVKVEDSNAGDRLLTIDALMQHANPLPPVSADQGQDVVTFGLVDCTDGTDSIVVTLVLPNTFSLA